MLGLLSLAVAASAVWSGREVMWLAAGSLLLAACALAIRRWMAGDGFPEVEIRGESEQRRAFVRLVNHAAADTFTARIVRVTQERSLSRQPPWDVPWEAMSGPPMPLQQGESGRMEVGQVVAEEMGGEAEFHFRILRSGGALGEVVKPWSVPVEEDRVDEIPPEMISHSLRAELEIRSERTDSARLVQVRIVAERPDWQPDVHVLSIEFGTRSRERRAIA